MRAVQIKAFGDVEALEIVEVPDPVADDATAVVHIKAASINPSDVKNVQGAMKQTRLPRIPGRDFAGKVASIAPLVESGNINARGLRTLTDVNVVEVMVDLAAPGPLAVGMKVDVFFRADGR